VRPCLASLALVLGLALAGAAHARVPPGFFGMNFDREAADGPAASQASELRRIARSGAQSLRLGFSWARMQPIRGAAPDFSSTDPKVAAASAARLELLPIVIRAPAWARRDPRNYASPPSRPSDYAAFLVELVRRYGPTGSFWVQHPGLPRRPLRAWQIWNEPHLRNEWDVAPGQPGAWPGGYAELLSASGSALRSADPGGKVVLGGLTGFSWQRIAELYRLGARGYFDYAAFQTYTSSSRRLVLALRLLRREMTRAGDRRKPIWITEMSWPASLGRTHAPSYQRSLQTTDRGMARKLAAGYRASLRVRRLLGVGRVYWYTWASDYRTRGIFNFSGLGVFRGGRFRAKPALRAYTRVARRYEPRDGRR
jgi:hypothetical protein